MHFIQENCQNVYISDDQLNPYTHANINKRISSVSSWMKIYTVGSDILIQNEQPNPFKVNSNENLDMLSDEMFVDSTCLLIDETSIAVKT